MSAIRKKVKYAKFLHDILCKYIMESNGKSGHEKEDLYHEYNQQWKDNVYKTNKMIPDLLNINAFKVMVDKKYVEYMEQFFPKLSFIDKIKLRLKKHSY